MAGVVVSAPLFVYGVTLAILGLPHVLSEFRYLDQRFGQRIGAPLGLVMAVLLGGIVANRVLAWLPSYRVPPYSTEIVLVLGLIVLTLPTLIRSSLFAALIGVLVVGPLAYGLIHAPATTLVILALLHNLTPVGFLAECLRGQQRLSALTLCAFAFVLVPLLIMSGRVEGAISWCFATWLPVPPGIPGDPSSHFAVYVPTELWDPTMRKRLFSAAVYLQCLHYAIVIQLLPRLGVKNHKTVFPWPRNFRPLIILAGIISGIGFYWAFADSRALYGVIAAVHAWIEIPILLFCLGHFSQAQTPMIGES